jgi:hypothetical protein
VWGGGGRGSFALPGVAFDGQSLCMRRGACVLVGRVALNVCLAWAQCNGLCVPCPTGTSPCPWRPCTRCVCRALPCSSRAALGRWGVRGGRGAVVFAAMPPSLRCARAWPFPIHPGPSLLNPPSTHTHIHSHPIPPHHTHTCIFSAPQTCNHASPTLLSRVSFPRGRLALWSCGAPPFGFCKPSDAQGPRSSRRWSRSQWHPALLNGWPPAPQRRPTADGRGTTAA